MSFILMKNGWHSFYLKSCKNAIKYFDKQENKLTIYSQDNGTNILLVIEDNGCGIKRLIYPVYLKKVLRVQIETRQMQQVWDCIYRKNYAIGWAWNWILLLRKKNIQDWPLHFQKEQFIIFQSNLKTMPTLIRCFKGACIMESFKYNSLQSNSTIIAHY